MTAELTAVLDDLSGWVWLRNDRALVVDSRLRGLIGCENEQRLRSCVEDNIFERDGEEFIDYAAAKRDFMKMMEAGNDTQ